MQHYFPSGFLINGAVGRDGLPRSGPAAASSREHAPTAPCQMPGQAQRLVALCRYSTGPRPSRLACTPSSVEQREQAAGHLYCRRPITSHVRAPATGQRCRSPAGVTPSSRPGPGPDELHVYVSSVRAEPRPARDRGGRQQPAGRGRAGRGGVRWRALDRSRTWSCAARSRVAVLVDAWAWLSRSHVRALSISMSRALVS